jgi:carbamoyltransferase
MYVLGLSGHHDTAAALVRDGTMVAFAEQERFSRIKHDASFPAQAIQYCLDQAGITLGEVDHVAYFWQGPAQLRQALRHFVRYFPDTLDAFRNTKGDQGGRARGVIRTIREGGGGVEDFHVGGAVLFQVKRHFTLGKRLVEALGYTGSTRFKLHMIDHHHAHAASAFFLSPFEDSAILTLDGIGSDGTSTYLAVGQGNRIHDVRRVKFPHSLGALYACVTSYLGFLPTRDEGKVMGLAPYGTETYVEQFKQLVHLGPDGHYELDLSWFSHHRTGKHTVSKKFLDTFGPARPPTKITASNPMPQHYADIAYALQVTLEETGLHLARWLHEKTGLTKLCMAGGVALNSVMNGRISLETPFEEFFAQPAAADDGSSLGAALYTSVAKLGLARPTTDYIFTGPQFTEADMEVALKEAGLEYQRFDYITRHTAAQVAAGKIVGWFQGRMECGPRALGNRSILADPRAPESRARMNLKVKHREPFRPFAPSCLAERAGEFFADGGHDSAVMLLVFDVLKDKRDVVPAITHVDGTGRLQTVSQQNNPLYWQLIKDFDELTGVPMVMNTSFNDNDEPMVCTPGDAVRCYLKTGMDALALGPFWTEKPTDAE